MEFHLDPYPEVNKLIAQHEEPYPSLVFTHGDLSSLNILACGIRLLELLIGRLLDDIRHIGNTQLRVRLVCTIPFGGMRLRNFLIHFPRN